MVLGIRKSQNLDLVERLNNLQIYRAVASRDFIAYNPIGFDHLTDAYIKSLSDAVFMQNSSISEINGFHVLEEGLYAGKDDCLTNLLIVLQYDFSKKESLIEIPGKYIGYDESMKELGSDGLLVEIVSISQRVKLLETFTRLSSSKGNSYTGNINIWPDSALKREDFPNAHRLVKI